jgi:hypothetical protein
MLLLKSNTYMDITMKILIIIVYIFAISIPRAYATGSKFSIRPLEDNTRFFCEAELFEYGNQQYAPPDSFKAASITFTNAMDTLILKTKSEHSIYSYDSFLKMPNRSNGVEKGTLGMTFLLKREDGEANTIDVFSEGSMVIFAPLDEKRIVITYKCRDLLLLITEPDADGDMFKYSLFNKVLNVALPHDPQKIDVGVYGVEMYTAADKPKSVVYTVRSTPTELDHDIGAYKSSFKETLDQLLTMPAKADNQTLVSFSSNFNKKANKYTAEMTTWFVQDGVKRFKSVKRIIYKKKIYDWNVMYSNSFEKSEFFDAFKNFVKIN